MRILIDQFQGMASRPDPAEVGSRFSRNIVFGPGGTWIETRPGTEQLTTETRPQAQPEGAVFPAEPEFASAYRLKDDRIEPIILVQATRDNTSIPRENFAPRLVCPVVFMPLSVVGFGADTPAPPPPDPPTTSLAVDDFQSYSVGTGVTLNQGSGWTGSLDINEWGT